MASCWTGPSGELTYSSAACAGPCRLFKASVVTAAIESHRVTTILAVANMLRRIVGEIEPATTGRLSSPRRILYAECP
ncbi:hypothetical protein [Kribbella sp. NPDC049227]|uniref:hypothetical protein n=1 Tax=Kribbella sp. NPDC049227 TaxID=3364113 RepID=UPI0037119497